MASYGTPNPAAGPPAVTRGAYGGYTPGPNGAQPTVTQSALRANLHLRGAAESSKPSLEKALAFRLKHHPSVLDPATNQRSLHECCTPTGRFCCKSCDWFDPFCEGRVSRFVAYGSGQTAYFKFLKLLTWVFVLMTVCMVPALLINVNGRGQLASLNALTLASTTLGNIGSPVVASVNGTSAANATAVLVAQFSSIPGWSLVVPKGTALTPTLVALIYSGSDLAACLVLFLAYLWLRAGEVQEERQVNKATVTADDYTVFLPGLPPSATEEGLRAHFSEYVFRYAPRPVNHPGYWQALAQQHPQQQMQRTWVEGDFSTVEDVHVVEDDTTLVQIYLQRGKMQRHSERQSEALRRLEEELAANGSRDSGCFCCSLGSRIRALRAELAKLRQAMAELSAAAKEHKSTHERYAVAAFVTFRYQAARDWVVESYGSGWLGWACQQRHQRLPRPVEEVGQGEDPRGGDCCCSNHLTVRPAPSPTAVIWTNLHVKHSEHVCRQAITGSFTLLLLGVSFIALWFASSQASSLQQQGALATCSGAGATAAAVPLLYKSPAIAALHGESVPATNATKYCTCAAMPWSSYSLATVQASYASTGLLDASDCAFQSCPRWLELDPTGVWKQAFCVNWLWSRSYAAIIVAGAAALVLFINVGLGYFMRQLTLVEGHHSWEYLNASLALRLFLATALNTGLLVVMINVAWPFVVPTLFTTGKYADFVPSWYDNVGTSLLTTS
jgi:hypothetical protein